MIDRKYYEVTSAYTEKSTESILKAKTFKKRNGYF